MLPLSELLNSMTVDELKQLLPFLPEELGGNRKAEIVERITNGLLGGQGKNLKQQYEQLDNWQQLAVAEALYDPEYAFHQVEFRAKYQHLPSFEIQPKKQSRYSFYRLPSRLRLFLFGSDLPSEFIPLLKEFVPEPPAVKLPSMTQLPETDKAEEEMQIRLCEQEALTDLTLLFRLVQQGKLKVSAKTGRATTTTVKLLAQSLSGGDFYDLEHPKRDSWSQEIGGIKAFAWPLLLQAANLAQISGTKLILGKKGTGQVAKPVADTLRLIWSKWQKTTLLDEFRRIETIKGQSAKGRVMTAVAPRRLVINAALQKCPVGKWIDVDNFFNYMLASKFDFDVAHDLWKLYLANKQYGALGYQGYSNWTILQGRYVLCLLFEYAATLGMVDVAYIDPEDARDDYRDNWGADDLDFLSRYDGLRYFRLTALGAYCLGITEEYNAPANISDCRFSILPSLTINLVSGRPSTDDFLLLDTWAKQEAENSWKLDKAKAIQALENGHDITVLEAFLQGKDEQLLPEAVEGFINTIRKQGGAMKQVSVALLLECSSEAIAKTLAGHQETRKLCQRVGKKQLVVKLNQEEKFRQAARIVGYGVAV